MSRVIFDYNFEKTTIECDNGEILENIIERFKTERGIQIDDLFFIKDTKEVAKGQTFEQLANSFDKEQKAINIFVFEKNFDGESIYSDTPNKEGKDQNQIEKLGNIITKMQNDINELSKNMGLVKMLKENIQSLEFKLKELEEQTNKNLDLNE